MSSDPLWQRLRSAKPVPIAASDNQQLWAQITATPGDRRLAPKPATRQRWSRGWWRIGARQAALLAGSVALTAAGGTAVVAGLGPFAHAGPGALFRGNPQNLGIPWNRRQTVIPGSVRRLETLTLPGVGQVQYWIAQSQQHGLCQAIQLPDGGWSGLGYSKFDQGGDVPGCLTVHQGQDGMVNDFYSIASVVGLRHGRKWEIKYGIVSTRGEARQVRDISSGITGRVFGGHVSDGRASGGQYFAIALPFSTRSPASQLEALDGSGHALARALPNE
jgi:hypothetical protein